MGCSPIKAARELGLERRFHCVPTEQSVGAHRLISVKPFFVTTERHNGAIPREGQKTKTSDAIYLAGFLDGDGSIHFQFVRQEGYRFGFYIRASMSLSQSTSARFGLQHLQAVIGGGYLRDRGTGMSDLVVTSRPILIRVLSEVQPYVIFKRDHVRRALWLLPQLRPRMEPKEFLEVAKHVDGFASLNYSKTKRITAEDVEQHLRSKGLLAPVSTSSLLAQRGDGVLCRKANPWLHNTPAP